MPSRTNQGMAGINKSPKWWVMKRAKDRKIKRMTKKKKGIHPTPGEKRQKPDNTESGLQGNIGGDSAPNASLNESNLPKLTKREQTKPDQNTSAEETSKTLSKQARKRREKRLKQKQRKESEKRAKLKPGAKTGKLGKDLETGRKEVLTKKPKQFKEKGHQARVKDTENISSKQKVSSSGVHSEKFLQDHTGSGPSEINLEGKNERVRVPTKKQKQFKGKGHQAKIKKTEMDASKQEMVSSGGVKWESDKLPQSYTSSGDKTSLKRKGERKEVTARKPKQFEAKENEGSSNDSEATSSKQEASIGPMQPERRKLLVGNAGSESETNRKRKNETKHLIGKKKNKNQEDEDDEQSKTISAGDVDKNWANLLKTLHHRPHKKKAPKETGTKPSLAEGTRNPEVWFDDVDPVLLSQPEAPSSSHTGKANPKDHGKNDRNEEGTVVHGLTKYIAMDCEMVGIGPGGKQSMLARVSLVNQHGTCIYDKYVAPQEDVTHYRTSVSGIRPVNLENAEEFTAVQKEVSNILKGRTLVGHGLHNDLKVLFLNHPKSMMRDTSTYKPFRELFQGQSPSLKKLCELILKVKIQESEHNSVEDAQAVMNLFLWHRKKWEKEARKMQKRKKKKNTAETLVMDSP